MSNEPERILDPEVEGAQHITILVGGKPYQMLFVEQCHTCTTPARVFIERMLIEGQRPPYIHREVAKAGYMAVPSVDSIRRHVEREHTTVIALRNQRILEETAEELGKAIDESIEQQVNQLALSRKIIDIRARDIMDGTEKPNDAVLKMAWDFLRDREMRVGGDHGIDARVYQRVIDIILSIASEHARDSAVLGEAILRDPFVAAFARALRGEEVEPQELTAS